MVVAVNVAENQAEHSLTRYQRLLNDIVFFWLLQATMSLLSHLPRDVAH